MRMKKQLLAILLALALVLTMLPAAAMADENDVPDSKPDIEETDPKDPDPETPKDPDPETPKDPDPETPKDPDPETPKDPDPETPKDPDPETPKDPDPETPKDPDPETPKDPDPETPTPEDPKPENPTPTPVTCTGTSSCQATTHNKDCYKLCTNSSSCPNTVGKTGAHQSTCPKATTATTPTKLPNPTSVSYNTSTSTLTWKLSGTAASGQSTFTITLYSYSTGKYVTSTTVSLAGPDYSYKYSLPANLAAGTYYIEVAYTSQDTKNWTSSDAKSSGNFTVGETVKVTDAKSAMEKVLQDGVFSNVKDIQNTILNAMSGSTTAARLKNLVAALQADTTAARALVRQVEDIEAKILKEKGITVSTQDGRGVGSSISSVTGLGVNVADSSNKIVLASSVPSTTYTAPSGSRAFLAVTLTVSGLSNNRSMDFPVQVAMKLPDSFNSSDKVYVQHYSSSGSSEKLDAYISGSNLIFTTTGFSDFVLVQENPNGYTVNVGAASNGTVAVDKKEAAKGATVTVTVTPAAGYMLGAMSITDEMDKGVTATKVSDSQYTFTMPESNVTVKAIFLPAQAAPSFTDVAAGSTFYTEISWAAQKGVMNGTGNGQFTPGGLVTRQQLWMVLGRMAGANPATMADARTWAMNNGISDGTGATNAMSRQQLVTMLYRYAQNRNLTISGSADLSSYPDHATVSGYAQTPLAWAVANGIVNGTSSGTLNPGGSATRGQFAAILYRFAKLTNTL